MNPLAVFAIAFFIWITSPLYFPRLSVRLKDKLGEIAAYWLVVSAFDVLLAGFITLLCPGVYFIRWSFPVGDFLVLPALAVLSFLPAVGEFRRFLKPESEEDREMVELIRRASFGQLALLQVISVALPEELVFRYIFLGLLSLWNPFVELIAVSLFFGISHKFSHPDRIWKVLLSNTLTGLVLGLGYLYTKSLLVVMAVHWLVDLIPVYKTRAREEDDTGRNPSAPALTGRSYEQHRGNSELHCRNLLGLRPRYWRNNGFNNARGRLYQSQNPEKEVTTISVFLSRSLTPRATFSPKTSTPPFSQSSLTTISPFLDILTTTAFPPSSPPTRSSPFIGSRDVVAPLPSSISSLRDEPRGFCPHIQQGGASPPRASR
ncbi:CPBP family intramembrane glutamic endopeptidase [Thermococcus piezophilus]|uniref:CPBP family intramembrane glutamic endopeptidase n=1 Tax=Thermococcus piezophilus TaxID=1712654 RepID=UPI000A553C6C|nr:type II CAAX endopeptidase family protein [Thermococcus piezophilus]